MELLGPIQQIVQLAAATVEVGQANLASLEQIWLDLLEAENISGHCSDVVEEALPPGDRLEGFWGAPAIALGSHMADALQDDLLTSKIPAQ